MQVCLNGHQITEHAATMPQFNKPFCSQCGQETITTCPECKAPIQGHYHSPGVLSLRTTPVPNNCHACGTAYPWRQHALAAAVEAVQLELDEKDAAEAAALIPDVAATTPRTDVAVFKLKKLLSKLQKPAYDIAIKVVTDVASETAKKTLGLKP
ncbi:DUF2321 domain-containing protein [Roseomonas sp. F4]